MKPRPFIYHDVSFVTWCGPRGTDPLRGVARMREYRLVASDVTLAGIPAYYYVETRDLPVSSQSKEVGGVPME
jgi:hypothetical protein